MPIRVHGSGQQEGSHAQGQDCGSEFRFTVLGRHMTKLSCRVTWYLQAAIGRSLTISWVP